VIPLTEFPRINATLNGITAVLLVSGWLSIKQRNVPFHRRFMLAALGTSTLFLACYLYYHFHHGATRFARHDWSRPLYFSILWTHTVLAIVNLPAIFVAVYYALRGNFRAHTKVTRWLFPSWMYVSITGVLVYFMLYHWFRT
jgi:putative membrane protein